MHGHIKERLGSEFFTDECNAGLNKTNVLLAKKKSMEMKYQTVS